MSQVPRQFPVAPLVVSVLLVMLAAAYLVRSPADGVAASPPARGLVRIVSWNRSAESPRPSALTIGSLLAGLNADVICLQGLVDGTHAGAIAERLGVGWTSQLLRGPTGRYLAVIAGPRLEVTAYHLIPTPAGDAVALTLNRPGRSAFQVVCLGMALLAAEPVGSDGHVAGVLNWCDAHPASLTVLAGKVRVDAHTRRRLNDRFADVAVADDYTTEIRVAPPSAKVDRAGIVRPTVDDSWSCQIAVVDLAVP